VPAPDTKFTPIKERGKKEIVFGIPEGQAQPARKKRKVEERQSSEEILPKKKI